MPISPEFDEAIEEIAEQLAGEESNALAAGRGEHSVEERLGLTLDPGRQVVDKVTGGHGIVVAGTIRHVLVPSS